MCDCYPVTSTVLAQSRQGPIRGLSRTTPSDSDDEPDPVAARPRPPTVLAFPPASAPTMACIPHPVPPVLSQLPAQDNPPYQRILCLPQALQKLRTIPRYHRILFLLQDLLRPLWTSLFLMLPHWSQTLSHPLGNLIAHEEPCFGAVRTGTFANVMNSLGLATVLILNCICY